MVLEAGTVHVALLSGLRGPQVLGREARLHTPTWLPFLPAPLLCNRGPARAHLCLHTHRSLRLPKSDSRASLGAAFSTRPSPTLSLSGICAVLRALLSLHSIHFSLPALCTAHQSSACWF